MKKYFFMIVGLLFLVGAVQAKNFTVSLTTFVPSNASGSAEDFLSEFPNISGGAKIDKLIFTTTNTITSPILITAYDTAKTTQAATIDGYWVMPETSSATHTLVIDYPAHNPLIYTNPAFVSNTAAATATILLTIIYR